MPVAVSGMTPGALHDPLSERREDDCLRARVAAVSEAIEHKRVLLASRDAEITRRSSALTAHRAERDPELHEARLRDLELQLIEAKDDLELSRAIVSRALNRTRLVRVALALAVIVRVAYLVVVGR